MYPQDAKHSSGAEQQFSSKINMPVTSRLHRNIWPSGIN